MSSITVCDRCTRQCTPGMRRSVLHLTELQFATADPRHPVAEDSYAPADLCDICTDVIKAAMGRDALKVGQRFAPGDDTAEMRIRQPEIPPWNDPVGLIERGLAAQPPTLEARERDIPERADARPEP